MASQSSIVVEQVVELIWLQVEYESCASTLERGSETIRRNALTLLSALECSHRRVTLLELDICVLQHLLFNLGYLIRDQRIYT